MSKSRHPLIALMWNPQGARKKGRPQGTWRRSVESERVESGKTWNELNWLAQDRCEWRNDFIVSKIKMGKKRKQTTQTSESETSLLESQTSIKDYFTGSTGGLYEKLLQKIESVEKSILADNHLLKSDLKVDMGEIRGALHDILAEHERFRDKIKSLEQENEKLKEEIKATHNNIQQNRIQINNLEQYSRKKNIKLLNVKENPNETVSETERKVIEIASSIDVTLDPVDIDIAHRVANSTSGKQKTLSGPDLLATDSINDRGTSMAKHFILDDHNHQHVNIIAIDQLPGSDNISLLNKETHWTHTHGTTEPHGMNIQRARIIPNLYSQQVMSHCSPPFTPSRAFFFTFLEFVYIFREFIGRLIAGVLFVVRRGHGEQHSEWFTVKSGARQGCVVSPILFLLVIDWVMKKSTAQKPRGIIWKAFHHLEDKDFADDIALLSYSRQAMQEKTTQIEMHAKTVGLKNNHSKSKIMRLRVNANTATGVQINMVLENVNEFKYLGSYLNTDGDINREITSRIAMASTAFQRLKTIWKLRHINESTKLKYTNQTFDQSCMLQKHGEQIKKNREQTQRI
ncbi:hypothetical protein ElyMa_003585500 [Elysia marginata]|uniref:Reverse transcriptase domain-containing protein n=1 Tax=Elysia marginata TaxID=1093978 RepID=A0AAV4EQ79_9GAST|nr:hypothetical protein ElyMa_003585500 [Elysia marginata]